MKKLVVLIAVGMLLLFAMACCTEYGYCNQEVAAKQNAIKLGVFRPQEGAIRDFNGSSWFMAAYERVITTMPEGADLTLEIGYTQRSNILGGTARVIPATLNYRQYIGRSGAAERERATTGEAYVGAGLGAYFQRFTVPVTRSDTKFGANIFVGYSANEWLVELKYHYIPQKTEDHHTGGFALMAGYKF